MFLGAVLYRMEPSLILQFELSYEDSQKRSKTLRVTRFTNRVLQGFPPNPCLPPFSTASKIGEGAGKTIYRYGGR